MKRLKQLIATLMLVLALASQSIAVTFEDTTFSNFLGRSFAQALYDEGPNDNRTIVFQNEPGFSGAFANIFGAVWGDSSFFGDAGQSYTLTVGNNQSDWFNNPASWTGTQAGVVPVYGATLASDGAYSLREVTLNFSLPFSSAYSAVGVTRTGVGRGAWALADPNTVNPTFLSDGWRERVNGSFASQEMEDFYWGRVTAVPEPATMLVLGAGLLAICRRKR